MGALLSSPDDPRPVARLVRRPSSTFVPTAREKNPCVHVPVPTGRSSIIYWMTQARLQEVPKPEWAHIVWSHLHIRSMCWRDHPYQHEVAEELLYLQAVFANLPCEECRKHSTEYFETHPPGLSSRAAYIAWMYDFHNAVNVRLEKPYFDWEEFTARYQIPLLREHVC